MFLRMGKDLARGGCIWAMDHPNILGQCIIGIFKVRCFKNKILEFSAIFEMLVRFF